ncbi:MAG: FtsX-like permease family protein, partial [Myxococcota bacterium]|nr:FtsX-like permease family protein [Myxococcota bacterium]
GTGLAALLTLEPGTRIFLETRSQQGAINAMQYTISGVVDSHNAALNAFTLWMPLSTAETLLQIQGERSHVSLRIDSREQAAVWKEELQIPNWTASTAIDEIEDLLHLNRIRRRALHFLSLILMAIAATGIANTILMATYERIPELGTLRALGFQRVQIALLLLFEGMSMGLIAGLVGVAIGSAINLYLHRYGIDLSTQSAAFGETPVPNILYTQFSFAQVLFSLLFGIFISFLGSLWPAIHAISIEPAEAMRREG